MKYLFIFNIQFFNRYGDINLSIYFLVDGELCDKDLENLKRWSLNITEAQGDNLSPQGYEDLYLLARRIKADFPDLLKWSYSQDLYQVSYQLLIIKLFHGLRY